MLKKRIVIFVVAMTVATFMVGAVLATADEFPAPRVKRDGKLTVAVCCHGLEAESCQRDFQQYKIECAHRGWKMIDCMTAGFTGAEQRSTLETLIRRNVDAIVLTYFDMEAVADLVIKAREKGIGVYNLDTEGRPGVVLNVTQNNAEAGAIITYWGLHRMNLRGNVVILSAKWHILRRRAYVAATLFERDFPAVTLLAEEFLILENYPERAYNTAAAWMTKYGNKIDWIFGAWDIPGIYAARAVEQAGYDRDDMFITGIDGGSQAYSMIRKGTPFAATISQPFELYAHTLFEAIEEVQVKGIAPGSSRSMVPKSAVIYKVPVLTDETNCPEPGDSIHSVFDYYGGDPNDMSAWYNWKDAGGPYMIQE
jgi:ABC-type sugar transport system substrate-binding protein